MKHIISLSLKYIRRQKLRTALTFLCVTLSVFILCSVTAYIGSIWQTVTNQVIREEGSYEASISPWLKNIDDKEKALGIIKNHAVVSDYSISLYNASNYDIGELNGNMMTCIEFSDGANTNILTHIDDYSESGNNELYSRDRYGVNLRKLKNGDGAIVPAWLKDLGYSEGDTLTFTLSPKTYIIDMDSQFIKEIRQKLFDEFGTSVVKSDEGFDELEYEERKKAYKGGLIAACKYYGYDLPDIPMTVVESGEPVELTLKINSFNVASINNKDVLSISRFDEDNYFFDKFFEKYPELMEYKSLNAFIRINENIDFDDGMLTLFGDLGFNPKDYYFLEQPSLNTTLLLLEFRSVAAIVSGMPFLVLGAVVIFFAWLVARFVIDNAFEISSQERSSQYASLRVMGASKSQITALVFTEALFYTIVSVPIGTIIAYILCNTSFTALKQMGFQDFEYRANPYFTIGGILLCVVAIFISAYTSAMWASRKLSPAEVLNFGKPKKKKKLRKRKSKINLGSKQFLRRYTSKNIARSKSRYIISTVTMTFGVMFFTFSLMLGIFFYTNIKGMFSYDDFSLAIDGTYTLEDAQSFRNEELFSKCDIYAEQYFNINAEKTDVKAFEKLHPYSVDLGTYFEIRAVDRYSFDRDIAELSGMTYDEFVKSGEAMYFVPSFGSPEERVYIEGEGLQSIYDKFYKKLDEPLDVFLQYVNLDVKVTSAICSDFGDYSAIVLPIDSDIIKDLQPSLYIKAKVNGKENYDEALKVYNDFIEQYESSIYDYNNNYAIGTGFDEFIKSIIKIVVSFIVSIWAVGILSMVNSINTSVLNRSRELIMLRSIGMSKKQLRKTVVLESVMFSAVSSCLGTLLAMGMFFLFMDLVGFKPTMLITMAVGLIASIGINILIAMLASVPALKSLERAESLVKTFE